MKRHAKPQRVFSSRARCKERGFPSLETESAGYGPREGDADPASGGPRQTPPAVKALIASRASAVVQLKPDDRATKAASVASAGADAILREKYRALARHHLRTLPALFKKFTGLSSHLAWAPSWPHRWSAHDLPTHSRLCWQLVSDRQDTLARCRRCAAQHLALAMKSGHHGHRFTCFMGVRNFWQPIILRGCLVGLAFVQALAPPAAGTPTRQNPLRAHRRSGPSTAARAFRLAGRGTKRMSRADFGEAAKLLQLVFQHVETSALADLRQSDLTRAQRALLELQTVATRLRGELNGLVPAFNQTGPVLEAENHTDRVVHAALEYIHQHYAQPFTLQQYAGRLRLNAAYLSAQFSHAVGIPFKTYLTEVRIERARELLGDASRSIAEVAYAVGYASENRFRIAFRHVTGLSPRVWRETLRLEPGGTA